MPQNLPNRVLPMGNMVRVNAFRGLQNLPLYVAQRQGLFVEYSIDVHITYTTGSAPQIVGLVHGDYDLIQTAPDNVINAVNNPAAFSLDPASRPDIVILTGGSVGPLSIIARPDLRSFEDLRGALCGVDNPTSGFAIVLRDMLARNGLILERDYTFTVAGSTAARLDALASGAIAATILYPPYDAIAAARGYSVLAVSTSYYPAYASHCTAGLRHWVDANVEAVEHYLFALRQSLLWIYDPKQRGEVESIMQQEPALALDASLANLAYDAFTDPVTGFGIKGKLDTAGLRQVISLRRAFSAPEKHYGVPSDYLDARWNALTGK